MSYEDPYFLIARETHPELTESIRVAVVSGAGTPVGPYVRDKELDRWVQVMRK